MVRVITAAAAATLCVVASLGAGPGTRPAASTSEPATPPAAVTLGEARARLEAAEGRARAQYRADLNGLLKRAMRDGDLRAANAASDALKELDRAEGKGRRAAAAGAPVRVSVPARGDWRRVMAVRQGDVLRVTAGGEWCVNTGEREAGTCGPDGLRPDGTPVSTQQWSVLMARVGLKQYVVGRAARIEVEQDGVLEMRINDWKTDDNDGAVAVSVVRENEGQ